MTPSILDRIRASFAVGHGPTDVADRHRSGWWLVCGALMVALSGNRFGIPLLGWVAPAPFMVYLSQRIGWKQRGWLLLALQLGVNLLVVKIVTDPIPPIVAPLFAVPTALGLFLAFLLFDALRKRLPAAVGLYLFPAITAVAEWLGYAHTEAGVWGASANTQLHNLALLQLASVTGVAGIGFLMSWAAALAAVLIAGDHPPRRWGAHIAVFGAALLLVLGGGSIRLFLGEQPGGRVRVGGVTTDVGLSDGVPGEGALRANTDRLFARSEQAVSQGAALVVWNEGATLVRRGDESRLIERGTAFARKHRVDFVLAYVVLTSETPLMLENKYVWLSSTGEHLETYLKHHPVPGEPSIRGDAPLRAIERPYGKAAGAICYDYDFPHMAVAHGRLGAGLVFVPASDWRGIDPYHTEMARLRAIEGGFSVFRPVRWATSAGFDAYGRTRGAAPFFENDDRRVLVVDLPTRRVETIYAAVGDLFAHLCLLFVLGCAAVVIAQGGRARFIVK